MTTTATQPVIHLYEIEHVLNLFEDEFGYTWNNIGFTQERKQADLDTLYSSKRWYSVAKWLRVNYYLLDQLDQKSQKDTNLKHEGCYGCSGCAPVAEYRAYRYVAFDTQNGKIREEGTITATDAQVARDTVIHNLDKKIQMHRTNVQVVAF